MENSQTASQEIIDQAKKEFAEEEFRRAVEQEKLKIAFKTKHPWYKRIFPWRIIRVDCIVHTKDEYNEVAGIIMDCFEEIGMSVTATKDKDKFIIRRRR